MATRKVLVLAGKGLLGIGLLWILLRSMSWTDLSATFIRANLNWVIFACIASLGQILVSAWRWRLLLISMGTRPPGWTTLVRHYFVGGFFNNFAPANLAGDASRIRALSRDDQDGIVATSSVVVERILNLVGLCALCIWALCTRSLPISLYLDPVTAWIGVGGIAGLVLVLTWLYLRPPQRLKPAISQVRQLVATVSRHPLEFGLAMVGTMILHLVIMLVTFGSARAVSVELPLAVHLAVYAIAGLVLAFPVSIQGIGVREIIYVGLMGILGIMREDVLAIILLNYTILVFFSILGGLLLWVGPRKTTFQRG